MIGGKILDAINQGKVTISIDGKPVMSLDRNAKSLELEISGLEKTNLKISNLFKTKTVKGKMLLESSYLVKKFTKNGWRFSLYDKGERLLTTSTPSKFGSPLHFNPLKLRRILRIL
ncbi:MAG: hypothetical protein ACREBB_08725 [Nitrosotalea sp.]